MRRYGGVLKFGAKTSVYLLTAAGCAALAHDSFNSADTLDFPSGFLHGVVRSSRSVFADFTSRQVLTMQFCEGHKVDDLEFLHRMGISPPELSEDFRKTYCRLWEALIILDSPKIQQLGETFGVGKYARVSLFKF
ncbi:UNVERIFIED_CONTAM: hypothetical protein Scaly_0079600 [Sesamum calycinum]|uniref:ABC1 atypical kinase-like domain-containing protein n=1 Tax=Sesamum calycinum TaxID=2727403 RepID=A0AAW2SVM6_9LAMI